MLYADKSSQWDLFSCLDVLPVEYCSILNKKCEFIELIKEYDTQVFEPANKYYCCIVPRNINPETDKNNGLFIFFFNEIIDSSFIGLCVKVNQDRVFYETNFISKFIKQTNDAICYEMKSSLIHVKCKTKNDAWNLFYTLYYMYLKREILTLIGAPYFKALMYSCYIKREKDLLEMLYVGSKVVNISKKSIFYKIHKKRKLSVTDLINTTFNMPRYKKLAMSFFRFKSYLNHDKSHASNTRSFVSGMVQKMNNMIKREILNNAEWSGKETLHSNFPDYMHSLSSASTSMMNQQLQTQKRKFKEVDCKGEPISTLLTSKFVKLDDKADCWETYKNFEPFVIKHFSIIPQVQKLIPNLLKDGSVLNNDLSSLYKNCEIQNKNTVVKRHHQKATALVVKHIFDTSTKLKTIPVKSVKNYEENISSPSNKVVNNHLSQFSYNLKDKLFYNSCTKLENKSLVTQKLGENCSNALDSSGFSLATGKRIPISNKAILAAHNIFKDVLFSNESKEAFSTDSVNAKVFKKDIHEYKNCLENSKHQVTNTHKEQYLIDDFDETCNILENSFTTASGKSIRVSEKAVLSAHKILKDITSETKDLEFIDAAIKASQVNSKLGAKSVGLSSKHSNIINYNAMDIDENLARNFFEDTVFDELDTTEDTSISNLKGNFELNDKNLIIHKPRKSLGGRRNIKYLDKL